MLLIKYKKILLNYINNSWGLSSNDLEESLFYGQLEAI